MTQIESFKQSLQDAYEAVETECKLKELLWMEEEIERQEMREQELEGILNDCYGE